MTTRKELQAWQTNLQAQLTHHKSGRGFGTHLQDWNEQASNRCLPRDSRAKPFESIEDSTCDIPASHMI